MPGRELPSTALLARSLATAYANTVHVKYWLVGQPK